MEHDAMDNYEQVKANCKSFIAGNSVNDMAAFKDLEVEINRLGDPELIHLQEDVKRLRLIESDGEPESVESRRNKVLSLIEAGRKKIESHDAAVIGEKVKVVGESVRYGLKEVAGLLGLMIAGVLGVANWPFSEITQPSGEGTSSIPVAVEPLNVKIRYSKSRGGDYEKQVFSEIIARDTVYSGEVFRISFIPRAKGYAYLFLIDSSGQSYTLFPVRPEERASPEDANPVRPRQYDLPGTASAYSIDDTAGEETIYEVFLKTPYPLLNELSSEMITQGRINSAHVRRAYTARLKKALDTLREICVPCVRVTRFVHRDSQSEGA